MTGELTKAERLERLHKKMVEEIQDYAIILLDLDGTILTWNKGAENIKGYKDYEFFTCLKTGKPVCLNNCLKQQKEKAERVIPASG